MSPKQLYFSLLSVLITVVVLLLGLYLVNNQQDKVQAVNNLIRMYNQLGSEMLVSARAIEGAQFKTWLSGLENTELVEAVAKEEYLYCPSQDRSTFIMAWVKNKTRLKAGSLECYSNSRGKLMVTLDCKNALICLGQK